jgi:predicted AlkP superfamily phosphohydrolase/phosphomutase
VTKNSNQEGSKPTETGLEDMSINKQSFSINPNKKGPNNFIGDLVNEGSNFQQMFNQYTQEEDMKAQNNMMQA